MLLVSTLLLFDVFIYIQCPYSPNGAEVQPGSVLLPASRRGRYLANIVRRQAVDGTGIKFNKDADRMNAESKKKVDVLSEELLPYIIAEQERRITLHSRVMSAIQNGEKGITIAEIRNKPPLLIRKGVMYRCPLNRAPKEPDGSGIMLCETDIAPTQIVYDSCLSAEDRDLYVTRNERYFFCNRHKSEGPDLPYNGSTIIGCAPTERTSLNYTRAKCVLEDSDDVVVHYRYYPDRTFKYVTELDPDREVCDHWNPCQIGYLYSIPAIDQAKLANDLWHDQPETPESEYQSDEIIESVPEDSYEEAVHPSMKNYTTSERRIEVPDGGEFAGVTIKDMNGNVRKINPKHIIKRNANETSLRRSTRYRRSSQPGLYIFIKLTFPSFSSMFYGSYSCIFNMPSGPQRMVPVVNIGFATTLIHPMTIQNVIGAHASLNPQIAYACDSSCSVRSITVRDEENAVTNFERNRYQLTEENDRITYIMLDLRNLRLRHFGNYFVIILNADGIEERLRLATVRGPERDNANAIQLERITTAIDIGGHFDRTLYYSCDGCEPDDVVCNNTSVIAAGRVSIVSSSKMFNFNFPKFDDSQACVYIAFFKLNEKIFEKTIAVIENNSTDVSVTVESIIPPPPYNRPFERDIAYNCFDCTVDRVYVNGYKLQTIGRESNDLTENTAEDAYFDFTSSHILIRLVNFKQHLEGVYQAVFLRGEEQITKTIMEIGNQVPDVVTEVTETTESVTDVVSEPTEEVVTETSETVTEATEAGEK